MRARALLYAVLTSGAVLFLGWEAGVLNAPQLTRSLPQPSPAPAPAGPSAGSATSSSAPAGNAASGTFSGPVEDTPFGSVQVQVSISGGHIVNVTPLKLTDRGGRSVEISAEAAPLLHDEVLKAQSANVDSISGATYTSQGYLTSLQAALDRAHFG